MLIRLRKICLSLLATFVIYSTFCLDMVTVQASADQSSYNYSYWEEAVPAPPAYLPTMVINGHDLGIDTFNIPNDIHVSSEHDIYIADTGNNQVVILNEVFEYKNTIDSFTNEGAQETFSSPEGVYVTNENHVYVADTGNNRVVHLDEKFDLVKIIDAPESEMLSNTFSFRPKKVAVDDAGRTFILSEGVFDGFMEFSVDGYFTTFIGANRVQVDSIDYLWRRFATREQRSQMVMFIPTEFTSLDLDEDGFIYATNIDNTDDVIKKINARGDDILRREGYFDPIGDIDYDRDQGPSRLIDIAVADHGIYSALDSTRGRIFTYNNDGFLMYVFGGLGNKMGEFHTPIAIDRFDEFFLVLDRELGEITVFHSTAYGNSIDEAVRSYEQGDEERAQALYEDITNMNINLEFAYTGIGKALLRKDEFEEAIYHFEQSLDQANYSKAYLLYRNEVLRENFSLMMGIIFLVIGLSIGFSVYRKKSKRKRVS
ncbi:NHL repeat-containing protein [Gracilibacillus salitolerans]|nr:NHL repeat-containing protein [Gracilibacillus salitolerans]